VGSNRASDRTATIDAKPLRWIEWTFFSFLSDRYWISYRSRLRADTRHPKACDLHGTAVSVGGEMKA
jgi:hypothetical protein